ncbi:hypothetical protein [Leptothermofonsia sp. ETS-13]|uniref:amino acid kinase family protein n=1 Tax=Leptothermofonsia sp. ETS-13 TaxID=3035696 RepID=UPI003BA04C6F
MTQTLVVKIGTSSLTQPETGLLALSTIASLVETLSGLHQQGHRVVLVSSGGGGGWLCPAWFKRSPPAPLPSSKQLPPLGRDD